MTQVGVPFQCSGLPTDFFTFSDIGPLQGPGCNIPSTGINDLTIETDTELDGISLIELNTNGPSQIGYWMLVTGQFCIMVLNPSHRT